MSFADFLMTIPPGQSRRVTGLGSAGFSKQAGSLEMYISIKPPPLELHREHCDGPRNFLGEDEGIQLRDVANLYLKYVCANCRTFEKTFSIHLSVHDDRAEAYKYGEMPPFGVAVPNRRLKILGKQRDNFLKGRRSENQGLGVDAFSYYRRVVKNQKNEILDEMIVISRKQGASSETLARWKMQRPRHNLARPLRSKARTVGLDSNQQPQSSHPSTLGAERGCA